MEKKMKGKMPDKQWTKDMKNTNCADMKYSTVPAPESYTNSVDKLAAAVNKNKVKYS